MKKSLLLTVSLILLTALCIGIGGTLAYLFVETNSVENTFEYGDIDITLTESDNLDLKMIPGNTITKDPKVTVKEGSEACWLFVKVEESENFDDFMTYAIESGWLLYPETEATEIDTNTNDTYVIYREVDATNVDIDIKILENDKVTVLNTVTKTMLNDESFSKPTLTFTAYAVQKANVATVEAAWALVETKGVPSNT